MEYKILSYSVIYVAMSFAYDTGAIKFILISQLTSYLLKWFININDKILKFSIEYNLVLLIKYIVE